MSVPPDPAPAEALLEQTAWVGRLARHLVGDADAADELTQETWLRALECAPRTDRSLRGWLATVMRNLVRERRRGDLRREGRERRAAREERLAPASDLVDRALAHRALVDEVLALDEPYRTTILARYFEGLSPSRISARFGVPVATVKTRLARGLDRLRERLDRRNGGERSAWVAALSPLAQTPALPLALTAALVMNAKLALSLVALSGAGVLLWIVARPEAAKSSPAVADRAAEPAARALQSAGGTAIARQPDAPAAAAVPPASTPPSAKSGSAPARLVRGRVIDVDSRGVPGLEVRQTFGEGTGGADSAVARTDADGRFALVPKDRGGALVVADPGRCTLFPGTPVDASTGRETIVVTAPRLEVAGRVVDEAGLPVGGALIRIALPTTLRSGLGANLDFTEDRPFEARGDAEGAFRFDEAPAVAGAKLQAGVPGFAPFEEPAPQTSFADLKIVLRRPLLSGHLLRGRVVSPAGAPVEAALVSLGLDTVKTDSAGTFSFDLASTAGFNAMFDRLNAERNPGAPKRAQSVLMALKAGYLPARLETAAWPEFVTLRLGGEPLSIAGTVVAPDGTPIEGAKVRISDPTFFGGFGEPNGSRGPTLVHAESLLLGSERTWDSTKTDEQGRFKLEGLLDRRYVVAAMEEDTLLRVEVKDIAAGRTGVSIVMPRNELYPALRGTVTSLSRRPIKGVRVAPMCDSFRLVANDTHFGTQHSALEGVVTDDAGRFELRRVPKDLVYLRLDGADTMPLEWGRGVEGGLSKLVGKDPEALTIPVARRCHFQVELATPEEADEVGVLDRDGKTVELSEFRGRGRREGNRQSLTDGRSGKLAASEAAATLVLYRKGTEVRRRSLALTPGEEATIRP